VSQNISLLVLLAIPLIGSIACFALPKASAQVAKPVAMVFAVAAFLDSLLLLVRFDTAGDRFQYQASWTWIRAFGVHFAFGVDGIALVLIAMTALLVPCVILASWNAVDTEEDAEETGAPRRCAKNFLGLVMLLEVLLIGVFAATDVFLFYVFFEAMLIPMYFIIGSFGGPRRQYAAMKFFLYSLLGGLLMLASVIGLYVSSGTSSFAFADLLGNVPAGATQKWIFLGFFAAFAIKAPLFPFHTWLPDAGAEAPVGGAVLMLGVMDKVGTFGFLRYCLPLLPEASRDLAPLVMVLSVIGILYAAFLAMGQRDMKRLVSYTSVAHFGFIGLGIFAFTTQAGTGAVLYMVNHGLSTGALFLAVGFLMMRGKSRLIADYGGAGSVAPRLGGVFLIAGLSALALPGMSTFISEFLVLVGTFTAHKALAIIATTGIILAALYVLLVYQRTMQGTATERVSGFRDLNAREIAAVAPLIALIIFLGVYPKPILNIINPAVSATMQDVGSTDPVVPGADTSAISPGGSK
jgi:NADH-quinone oxidoreductase subunit M